MLTDNGTHYLGVLYDIKRFRRDCCVYWALLQTQSSVLDGRPTVHHTPGESQQRLGAVPRTTAASVSPTYGTSLKDKSIGDRKGGGHTPWNLKKMTSYAALQGNTLKFSLAPSSLAINYLKCSRKRRKNAKKYYSFAPSAFGVPENCQIF